MDYKTVDMRPGAQAKKNHGHGTRPSKAKKQEAHSLLESAKRLADEAEQEEKAELEREAEQAKELEAEQLKQAEIAETERLEQEYQDSLVLLYKSRLSEGRTEIEVLHKNEKGFRGGQLVDPEQLAMHNSLPVKLIAKNRFASLVERGNYFELVTNDKNSPTLVNFQPLAMCRLVKNLGLEYIQKV